MIRRTAAAAVWLAILLLCIGYIATAVRISMDLGEFAPAAGGDNGHLLQELQQSRATRLLLLAVEGGTLADRTGLSERLAPLLRNSDGIRHVFNGDTALDAVTQDLLFRYRYLLSEPQRFDRETLRASLQARLNELASPLPSPDRHLLPADPTAAYRGILQALQPRAQPRKIDGVWVSEDAARALLLVELEDDGLDVEAQAGVIRHIRQHFAELERPQALQLIISGPAYFAAQASQTIRAEVQLLSGVGTGFLVALLLIAYRSPRLILLSALPLVSAIVVATAIVAFLFGSIHGITLAFGMTMLGVALDYPLHLFSHHSIASGKTMPETLWPTLWLAVLTTLVGYLNLAWTDFTGLAQLGVYAGTGLLVAASVTRWVLPGLLPTAPVAGASMRNPLAARLQPDALPAWAAPAATVAIVLGLVAVVANGQPLWEEDLEALAPIPPAERALDRELRLQLGAAEPGQLVVVAADNAQQALERSEAVLPLLERLRREGALEYYEAAAHYLPSVRLQRERQRLLPDAHTLAVELDAAQAGSAFKQEAFAPFLESMATARTLLPLTPEAVHDSLLGARLESLLYQRDGRWLAVVPLIGVHLPQRLGAAFAAESPPGVHYLDLRQVSTGMMLGFRDEALGRLAWGVLAVAGVLAFGLRSLRAAAAVVSPILLAGLATVASLVASGHRLSLFHLIALLLVAGVGLDYSLFFRRWSRSGGHPRTLHALLACFASTFGVFAILACSGLPVLSAIGLTVAIGVAFSFVLALLFSAWAKPGELTEQGSAAIR